MPEEGNIIIKMSNGQEAGRTLKELSQAANRLKREINDLEPGSDRFVEATKDYRQVTGRLKDIRQELKAVDDNTQDVLSSFSELIPFKAQFDQITRKIGMGAKATKGWTMNFKLLRAAIIATGIGALIVLLTSLVGWFTKTQRGIEIVNQVMAGLEAAMDAVAESAFRIIDGIGQILSGNFSEGFAEISDSFRDIGDNIERDVRLATQLAAATDALIKKENDFILTQAKRKAEIQELIFLTRDETATYEERQAALQRANELELANMEDQLALQRERVRIAQEDYDRAESTEEDRKALIEEQARLEDMRAQSLARQREIRNRVTELTNKQLNAEKQLAAQREKDRKAQEKADADEEKRRQAELKKQEEDRKAEATEAKRQHDAKLERLALEDEELRILAEEQFILENLTQAERDEIQLASRQAFFASKLQLLKDYYGEESAEVRKFQNEMDNFTLEQQRKELAQRQEAASVEQGINQVRFESGRELYLGLAGLASSFIKNEQAANAVRKLLGIAEVGINLQRELGAINLAAAQIAAQLPLPISLTVSAAYRRANMTRALIQAGLRTAKIATFEQGGEIRGPRHTQGGIIVELEGGEFVMSRKTVAGIGMETLRRINASFNKYESGGPVGFQETLGSGAADAASQAQESQDLMSAFVAFTMEISAWQRELRVINNAQDTQAVNDAVKAAENEASF
jgi:chemotaxis protein histidine kinase CheA